MKSELIQYLEAAFLSSLFECTQNLTLLKLTNFPQKTIALELGSQQIADFQSATNLQQGRAIKNGKLLICTD